MDGDGKVRLDELDAALRDGETAICSVMSPGWRGGCTPGDGIRRAIHHDLSQVEYGPHRPTQELRKCKR